jgi:hypothetical protein
MVCLEISTPACVLEDGGLRENMSSGCLRNKPNRDGEERLRYCGIIGFLYEFNYSTQFFYLKRYFLHSFLFVGQKKLHCTQVKKQQKE